MGLKRHISFIGLYFTLISASIGSGWLFAPYIAAKLAGPLAVIAWPIAALLLVPIILCFVEMASNFPVTGGLVRFLQCTHGSFLSFICSWMTWLSSVLTPAIEVEATLEYSSYYFPELISNKHNSVGLSSFGLLIAAILMFIFVILNNFGIKLLARINNVISIWKLVVPSIAIIALLILSCNIQNFHMPQETFTQNLQNIFTAIATGGIAFSIIGFRTCIEMAGEISNPTKNLARAILLGFLTCTIFYTILQFAFIGALSPEALANGWQHLQFVGKASPLISLLATVGVVWLVSILYLDAIVSPYGTGLLYSASTARVLYAMSRNGFLPKILQHVNHFGVPILAVLVNFIVGMLMFLPFSGWRAMASFFVSLGIMGYGLGAVAAYAMRRQCQPYQRTLPLANIVNISAFYITSLYLYWTGWTNVLSLFIANCIGVIVFIIYVLRQKQLTAAAKPALMAALKNSYWYLPFLVGLLIIAYFGQYGGNKTIPFGWDYMLLLLLTIPCFFLAFHFRLPPKLAERPYQELLKEATQ